MRKPLALPITMLLFYAAAVFLNASFARHLTGPKGEADIIQRVFGNLRVFVGDWAFIKAEEYHHRGLPFDKAFDFHKRESVFTGKERREGHDGTGPRAQNPAGLYSKLYAQVKVTADSHLKPEEEKEALPWFYIEVAFNPHDIRGYVMGAYWLDRIGRRAESLKFLREGSEKNPLSAQILSAIGETYMKENNYEEAENFLERSRRLWSGAKGVNVVSNSYAESDRLFTFDLLASLYAKKGEYEKALNICGEFLKFGPNPVILDKAEKLKTRIESVS
ncbi:MAG: tetratricopeptide repeat protein [Candidatus Omnitrophota bacterium]|nr:tetratricopeptide repeat protein [Candidatus Omnitrophota bacterium]